MGVKLEQILLDELCTQCRFILRAVNEIRGAIREENHSEQKVERVWYSIQMLLIATANTSKLLEAEELNWVRAKAAVEPLRDRRFRNHFEHYDERLRSWWASHGDCGAAFIDRCFTLGQKEVSGNAACLRNFDLKNWVITFRGEEYFMDPIERAAKEICAIGVVAGS